MEKPPLTAVFIANIPYRALEEELKEVMEMAGRVVEFRVVYDYVTGRSKGCSFQNKCNLLLSAC